MGHSPTLTSGVPNRESVEDNLAFVRHPSDGFDPARDILIAEVEGKVVGGTEQSWVDTNDGLYREYRVNGCVHPDWRRRGIGTALLVENERRARELAATHQTSRELRLGSWSNDRQVGRIALLKANGYEPVRWFFDMTRPLSEPIPEVPLPDGLDLRPVTMDNIKQVFRADVEAFKDHWGGFEDSDEQLQRWMDRPNFDPTLWVVAWDVSKQPPWSIATSTITERGFIRPSVSRVTRCGATAPGTSTAPMTTSASRSSSSRMIASDIRIRAREPKY